MGGPVCHYLSIYQSTFRQLQLVDEKKIENLYLLSVFSPTLLHMLIIYSQKEL